jgi:ABC-type nitrate/sulfonate/bicarbonate transport system substrate-binding protein
MCNQITHPKGTAMKNILILALLLALLATAAATARTGSDYIAWDFGGWDAELGIFLCPAGGYYDAAGNYTLDWVNPLAPIFPELVTDC